MRHWKILIPATIIASLFTYFIVIEDADIKHGELKKLKILPAFVEKTAIQRNVTEKDLHVSEVNVFPTSRDLKHRIKGESMKPLTIQCNNGQLGNQMNTYATLYGVARYNNRKPEGMLCNVKQLLPIFELTSEISNLSSADFVGYSLSDALREEDLQIPEEVNILQGFLFPRSYTFFHEFKDDIRKEFTFKPPFREYAKRTLNSIVGNRSYEAIVGMHVRRTDYCHHLTVYRGRLFDMNYLEEAMDYFRQKYHPVLFILASDDRDWCHKALRNFEDVVISPKPPGFAYDMALLSSCNHSLITYGSFGFWGAYLAGGETVYFKDYLSPDSSFLKMSPNGLSVHPPEWIGVSTTSENFWSNYTPPKCK